MNYMTYDLQKKHGGSVPKNEWPNMFSLASPDMRCSIIEVNELDGRGYTLLEMIIGLQKGNTPPMFS